MSLDALRDAISREKKNEIANCELSRKRKLRELYNYTALLNAGHPPQLQDWLIPDEPGENERRFLDENDISKGRHFRDSTLPLFSHHPSPQPPAPFLSRAKSFLPHLAKSSPSPSIAATPHASEQANALPFASIPSPVPSNVQVSATPDALSVARTPPGLPGRTPVSPVRSTPPVSLELRREAQDEAPRLDRTASSQELRIEHDVTNQTLDVDGPSAAPENVIPPTADDVAELPDSTLPATATEEPPKPPPQVVHLPSQAEQEERLQETERNLQKAAEKERREEEKLGPPAGSNVELASSPSSTVGPYSAATPHAQHHSPDTSPGSDNYDESVGQNAPPGLVDPAAQLAKEEHDRALQAQIEAARKSVGALSPETPDAQLQLEDEQAIRLARDGKSRLTEAQPATEPNSLTQHVQDVVQPSQKEADGEVNTSLQEPAAESLPTPATTVPEPSTSTASSVENVPEKQSEPAAIPEQPTPPADVEMDDVPSVPAATKTPSPSRPQRMTTRVSSGSIPRRSVSDIIRDATTPKTTPKSRKTVSPTVTPPRPRSCAKKEKPKVPTVIFAKPGSSRPSKALQLWSEDYAALQGASQDSSRDYLQGLFQYQAHHQPRSIPLQDLLASARKTVSTAQTLATLRECQDYKILKRVYQLQNANRWSLRQLQKSAEPPRPVTHLDHLLAEMKWMQTDFKEERKWKKALASTFAEWCAEYVNSTPEQQSSLRIRARIPQPTQGEDEDMNDAPTPDLISSGANEAESDDELFSITGATPPAALFTLGFNDVVMKMDHNAASLAILQELPLYEPDIDTMTDITPASFCDPPLLPVSKFVTGKLISKIRGPPRKRSRYEYDSEDEPTRPPSRSATSAEHSMPSTPGRRFNRNDLPPEMTDVALFIPENKHVRDRLQAAHHFRPPSEYPMPTVAFFENRVSSQWLWDEDQKLRTLVREHTFNWSLVAQELSFTSAFTSGAERRTPWECFERWVQLEGLPGEMARTQYFRTYQTRLEQAQRTVTAQQQAQQQLQQAQGQNAQVRRRTTQPIRVERRRNNRYLGLIDSMRKLARKREQHQHKQQDAQKAAALRKAHEPAQQKNAVHSPQEFSRLRWEREEKLREQQQAKQQQINNMRTQAMVTAATQRQASMVSQAGMANGVNAPQRNGTPVNGNVPTPMSASTSQQGHPTQTGMQARPHPGQPQMQANFPNGNMSAMSMGMSGIPQAQMQANMQGQQRMGPPDNVRLATMQRQQFPSSNQHPIQFQQQQMNMVSNLASAHLGASNLSANAMQNAGMMAAMAGQNMNGTNTASMNGMPGAAVSPRMGRVNTSRPLSSGHMPHISQIQNNYKQAHPEWSTEQVNKAASDHLTRVIQQQRVNALSAASGSPGMGPASQIGNNVYVQNGGLGGSPPGNPVQTYQNQLLQQQRIMSQQRSQQAGSPSMNNAARPPSRSATPQNPQQMQQSPGMQQAQLARN